MTTRRSDPERGTTRSQKGDLYQVDVPHFCAGLVVYGGVVGEAAPILNWVIGKPLSDLERWVRVKGGTLVKVPPLARP